MHLDGYPQGQREQGERVCAEPCDKDRIAEELAREWQQVRLRERMEWRDNYAATAIAI
jgi:hypothetical protein